KRQRPLRTAGYRRRNFPARSRSEDPPCGAGQRQSRSLRTWLSISRWRSVYALVSCAAADVTFEPRHCELSEAPVVAEGSFQRGRAAAPIDFKSLRFAPRTISPSARRRYRDCLHFQRCALTRRFGDLESRAGGGATTLTNLSRARDRPKVRADVSDKGAKLEGYFHFAADALASQPSGS